MSSTTRRDFLRLLGASAVTATLTQSIERARAIPAVNRRGTIEDVKYIVILTQENRAFDHYFGSLRGVRGFNDPRAVRLPNGNPVWLQPNGNSTVLPFRVDNAGGLFIEDVVHGWNDGQRAWNNGKYDQWIPNKGTTAMTYMNRQDLPYHFALADAFTICDSYFSSVMGPTDPNRYYMLTGWLGNDGKGGGPVITNAEAGYDWSSFPELLDKAGISWKIYQDSGVGLDAAGSWGWTGDKPYIGNYGDNSLLYLHQYQNALPGSSLYEKARRGTNIVNGGTFDNLFDILRNDVRNGVLPAVSWIATPEVFSEHPNWIPGFGAWYISKVLDILTSNPDVWSQTVFFINYDEGGGFFDHVVGPYPATSSAPGKSTVDPTGDIFPGDGGANIPGPYGLGVRVPLFVVSPWSRGGYVCSEVFDHTSLIKFVERRYARTNPGLLETNIPAWRRAVCGDLTSAFDFRSPNQGTPPLPATIAPASSNINSPVFYPSFHPVPPANPKMPSQEPGVRPARPLPYIFVVEGDANLANKKFAIGYTNSGAAGVCFHVRSGNNASGPWSYTVEAGKSLSDVWDLASTAGRYDLSVYGPNGYFRSFKGGGIGANVANVKIDSFDAAGEDNGQLGLGMVITNKGPACTVTVTDNYTGKAQKLRLAQGQKVDTVVRLEPNRGWYDLAATVDTDAGFKWQLAGHVENGRNSISDPAMA